MVFTQEIFTLYNVKVCTLSNSCVTEQHSGSVSSFTAGMTVIILLIIRFQATHTPHDRASESLLMTSFYPAT